jgi:tetratricopeptide (TPR) repeat protein
MAMLKRSVIRQISRVLAIFSILLLAGLLGASRSLDLGDAVPDFVSQDISGTELSLTSLRGKIVIIVFWRAEQKRSIEALTALQSIYMKTKEQGVEVLALSSDEGGPELIGKVKQSKQFTFPMLYDREEKAYGDYGVMVMPSTFIIDKAGKLSYYYPGYRDDFSRQISGRVDVLLGKKTLEELQAELQPVKRPEISEAEKKARRYLKAGNRLLEKGMTQSAMLQYQKAVQEEPNLFEAHLRLGDIYLNQENIQEADSAFKQAIKLKSRSADAHAGLGDVLFLQGQLEKAVETLQIALRLNPKLARAHYRLGRVYEEQKRIEDALKEYKIALRILLKIEE